MIKMTEKARRAASGLAVAYAALGEAIVQKNWHGVAMWAPVLSRRQAETGVEMHTEELLERLRVEAEEKLARLNRFPWPGEEPEGYDAELAPEGYIRTSPY